MTCQDCLVITTFLAFPSLQPIPRSSLIQHSRTWKINHAFLKKPTWRGWVLTANSNQGLCNSQTSRPEKNGENLFSLGSKVSKCPVASALSWTDMVKGKTKHGWGPVVSVELFISFQCKKVSGEEVCNADAQAASLYRGFLRALWTGITFNHEQIFSFLPDLDHDLWPRVGRWTWGPQGKYQPDSAYFQLFLLGVSFSCLQGVVCLDLSARRTVQHPECKHMALHRDLPLTPSPAKALSPSLLFWLPGLLSWTRQEYFLEGGELVSPSYPEGGKRPWKVKDAICFGIWEVLPPCWLACTEAPKLGAMSLASTQPFFQSRKE